MQPMLRLRGMLPFSLRNVFHTVRTGVAHQPRSLTPFNKHIYANFTSLAAYKKAMTQAAANEDKGLLVELVRQMKAEGVSPYPILGDACIAAGNMDVGFDTLLQEMSGFRQQLDNSPQALAELEQGLQKLSGQVLANLEAHDNTTPLTSPYSRQLQVQHVIYCR